MECREGPCPMGWVWMFLCLRDHGPPVGRPWNNS